MKTVDWNELLETNGASYIFPVLTGSPEDMKSTIQTILAELTTNCLTTNPDIQPSSMFVSAPKLLQVKHLQVVSEVPL